MTPGKTRNLHPPAGPPPSVPPAPPASGGYWPSRRHGQFAATPENERRHDANCSCMSQPPSGDALREALMAEADDRSDETRTIDPDWWVRVDDALRAALATPPTQPRAEELREHLCTSCLEYRHTSRCEDCLATPAPLDVERLARALPAVSHVLWSRSQAGDHLQVWFDEDVLRHFNEWAEDTAAAIARAYAEQEGGA